MGFNINKLKEIAKPRDEKAKKDAEYRKQNRDWITMSQDIAIYIHHYLKETKTSQKDFAERLGVSPVYVVKLLKGSENLTLETICKLQRAMNKELITIEKPNISVQHINISAPIILPSEIKESKKFTIKSRYKNDFVTLLTSN